MTSGVERNQIGAGDIARLAALGSQLREQSARMRFVDYAQAETDCEVLSARLLEHYSHSDLDSFSYVAIPRGGLVVLGILSYVLNLRPSQLEPNLAAAKPLVVVDDCALSGLRFRRLLARTASAHVVFAHLYSVPELRRAILEAESRVKCCVAAQDLASPRNNSDMDPAEYQAWLDRWVERAGAERYWVGPSEAVCFAWSEPEHQFWNETLGRVESGWHFSPPSRCLKNKWTFGLPPKVVATRSWVAPTSVVYGFFDGSVWLCNTDTQQVYSLNGAAADIWFSVAAYGDLDAALQYLLSEYAIDEASLRNDMSSLVDDLVGCGLLCRTA